MNLVKISNYTYLYSNPTGNKELVKSITYPNYSSLTKEVSYGNGNKGLPLACVTNWRVLSITTDGTCLGRVQRF